jgi:predicted esterase YcpF (UPF0227 family)
MTTILYLHGFNSAFDASSSKVQQLTRLTGVSNVVGIDFPYHCEELVPRLDAVVHRLNETNEEVVIAGTSLGGFFARYLANRHVKRLITINPSLEPWLTLQRAIGVEQQNFKTGERYVIAKEWLEGLSQLAVNRIQVPAFTVISLDDEVLHYDAAAMQRLNDESQVVMTSGGHRLEVLPAEVVAGIEDFIAPPASDERKLTDQRSTGNHHPSRPVVTDRQTEFVSQNKGKR